MSGMHRFWSIFADASCSEAPTGVFIQRRNECAAQVASSGKSCDAQYDSSNAVVGYVEESCREGRAAGLDDLYNGESYMAYDYYYDNECSDYENTASYRASGDCETLYDGYSPVRSATVSISSGVLAWTRNMGSISTALNCPGATGTDYFEFDVPIADINSGACKNFNGIEGGFIFYNTSATVSTTDTSSSDVGRSSSAASSTISSSGSDLRQSSSGSASQPTSSLVDSNSASSSSSRTPAASLNSGLAVGAVAGIAGGVLAVVVIILAVVFCLWRRRQRDESSHTPSLHHPFIARGSAWSGRPTDNSEPSTLGSGLWNDNAIIATRVPRDQIVIQDLICRGGFGEVYRGTYNHEIVAIKMLHADTRSDLKKVNAFLGEAKLMAALAHPNIVRFVGVSWGSLIDLCVLTEFIAGGDLRALLKQYDERGDPKGFNYDKIRIAYHVAQALTYLHSLSPVVIHRDLKSKNVLLTEGLAAKITDFGASRERMEHTMTAGVGTMLWMAPEVMMAEHYDEKADIFSFGVLLSELDLHTLPYSHARFDLVGKKVPDAVIIQRVASGALHVAFSPRCLTMIVELGNECVALDPSARPSAPMVVFRLQTIMKEVFRV